MADQNVTTKFIADVSEFKSGIAQANQSIKLANAQFKAASAGLEDWENSTEGLQAKLQQLEAVIEAENKKLKAYKDQLKAVEEAEAENGKRAEELRKEYQKAVEQYGENSAEAKKLAKALADVEKEQASNSKAADKLRITILNQTATVNKAEKEHRQYTKALEDVETADERSAKAAEEAARAAEEKAKEIEKAKKEAEEAAKAEKKLEEASKDLEGGFSVAKAAVADFISDGIQKLISTCWDGIKALASLADETQEYREDMAKLEVAFEKSGHSAEEAYKVYEDFYGILGESDRSIEAVNHLAKFVDNQKDLATWSKIAAGVTAEFGDSLPIEGLTEAANETARTATLTGPLTDALNWAAKAGETYGIKLKENIEFKKKSAKELKNMTEAQKEEYEARKAQYEEIEKYNQRILEATSAEEFFQMRLEELGTEEERVAFITETLNDLYGESGEAYSEMNKSIIDSRKATSRYNDELAKLGKVSEPVVTTVKNGFADILEEVNSLVSEVNTEEIQAAISDGFKYFIDSVIPAIIDGFKWIKDNWQSIATGISAIAGAFIAFKTFTFITTIVSAFAKLNALVKAGQSVWAALNVVMNLNPIGIIITLIGALVGAFIYLWNTSDEFRAFWINLWNIVKDAAVKAWDAIKVFFGETVPEIVNSVVEWFAALPGKIGAFFSRIISDVKEWAINLYNNLYDAASSAINAVLEWFRSLPGKIQTWLSDVISKVVAWGTDLVAQGKAAAKLLVDTVVEKVGELPGKMLSAGQALIEGLWNGINDKVGWIKDKIMGFVGDVESWFCNFFGINSPSKLMRDEVGKWIPEGIAEGITRNVSSVKAAVGEVANSATSGLGQLNEGSTSVASSGMTFNQYNYSPKSLSRLEIYRQTQNQLRFASKGVT